MKKIIVISLVVILSCIFVSCNLSKDITTDIAEILRMQDKSELEESDSWTLPDLSGWSCAEVSQVLDDIGQEYEITFTYDAQDMNVNTIIDQSPVSGVNIQKDEVLQLMVNNYCSNHYAKNKLYFPVSVLSEMGKWKYFTDGRGIYRSNNDFKDVETIYSHENDSEQVVSIVPRSDKIYFVTEDDELDCMLYSVSISSKEFKRVAKIPACPTFFVTGDTLNLSYEFLQYDINENRLYEMQYSSTYTSYNQYIYYSTVSGLARKNLSNMQEEILIETEGSIFSFCLYDDVLYYVYVEDDTEWLYKFDIETKENVAIIEVTTKLNYNYSNKLYIWNEHVIVVNTDRIIKVDIKTNRAKEIKIRIPDKSIFTVSSIICGNYIYVFDESVEEHVIVLLDGRYNLLTEEYEEFDWDEVIE